MLSHKRHQKIMSILNDKKSVSNHLLLDSLFVSEATLRRDLSKLESLGLITRTHGFTHLKEASNIESSLIARSQKNVKEKKRIAQKCLDYLNNNSSIFIDSSSTVGYLLPILSNYRDLTFITNGISNALILSQANVDFKLHITPGVFNHFTNSLLGIDTVEYIKNFHCEYSIFSCGGLSPYGITEANHEQSLIKREMLKRSKTHILLVDNTKFNHIYMSQTCDFNDIDIIITDKEPDKKYIDIFKTYNCQLIVV